MIPSKYIRCLSGIIIFLFLDSPAKCQLLRPDGYYRAQSKYADSIIHWRVKKKVDSTTFRSYIAIANKKYLNLSKKYEIDNLAGFFYLSVAAEDSEAFYTASKALILNTGNSLKQQLDLYGNLFGDADITCINRKPMSAAYSRIKKEEAALIRQARLNLDWRWNIELVALNKANTDFRRLYNYDFFRDSIASTDAMVLIDSFQFVELCDQISQYGYPSRKKVGLNSYMVHAPLKHFSGLMFFKKERAQPFIDKWKWIIPYVHDAALDGSIDFGFYKYLINDLIVVKLGRDGRNEDADFFSKFRIEY